MGSPYLVLIMAANSDAGLSVRLAMPNTESFSGLVKMDDAGYIIAGEDTKTSRPGIFAAGDLRTKPLRQVITAAADGANAITAVEEYLHGL